MKHAVIFRLKVPSGSREEERFMDAAAKLAGISGVINFEIMKQVSPKNNFDYSISMEFASDEEYRAYNEHPLHRQFIDEHWLGTVEDFLEIDLMPLPQRPA